MSVNSKYVSKYGYAIPKDSISIKELIDLKSELVAKPITGSGSGYGGGGGMYGAKDTNFGIFKETPSKIYIPKMYGIEKYGLPSKIFKNYYGKSFDNVLEFKGELYDRQFEPRDVLYSSCVKSGGGILNIPTGYGKTTIALNVVTMLNKKTIIIVNKISLLNQWKSEISRFIPDAEIGIIQGQKFDVQDKHVVIAMLQSLSKIQYPDEIFTDFGTVIVDECHNTCTRMFSKIFFKLCCQYSIGLSATPERSDGCEYVFKWHLGDIVYGINESTKERTGKDPVIHFFKLQSTNYKQVSVFNNYKNQEQIQYTSMITELVNMQERNDFIIKALEQLMLMNGDCGDDKRKVLVMSDRRNHITRLHLSLLELKKSKGYDFTVGIFMGSMKTIDLENAKKCDIILATYSSFAEGVSVYDLNTILLLTPKKYVDNEKVKDDEKKDSGKMKQIIGRIFRKDHIETHPLIIDLCDDFSVYKSQAATRKKFYKKNFKNSIVHNTCIDLNAIPEFKILSE